MFDPKNIFCLFFDVDNTLLFDGKISQKNIKAIKRMQRSGAMAILNTGRSRGYLPSVLFKSIKWDGIIAGFSYAEFKGKTILDERLDPETVRQVAKYCIKTKTPCKFEGVHAVYSLFMEDVNPKADPEIYLEHRDTDVMPDVTHIIDRFLEKQPPITKMTVMRCLEEDAQERFPGLDFMRYPKHTEVLLKGYSKASGMELIQKLLLTDRAHLISFGDSVNDLAMFKYAGISVIISQNADKTLDNYAIFRTKNDRDGVAEGIELIFGN